MERKPGAAKPPSPRQEVIAKLLRKKKQGEQGDKDNARKAPKV